MMDSCSYVKCFTLVVDFSGIEDKTFGKEDTMKSLQVIHPF